MCIKTGKTVQNMVISFAAEQVRRGWYKTYLAHKLVQKGGQDFT
jgi:hypothetical protein